GAICPRFGIPSEQEASRRAAPARPLGRRHALFSQLAQGIFALRDGFHAHAREHLRRFGELAIVVGNDFDAVAPRVEDVHALIDAFDAVLLHRAAHRFAVVHHQTEVAFSIRRLSSSERELDELIAEIDKRVVLASAAQRERKQPAVEFQRPVEIADFEDHVVDAQGARLGFAHRFSPLIVSSAFSRLSIWLFRWRTRVLSASAGFFFRKASRIWSCSRMEYSSRWGARSASTRVFCMPWRSRSIMRYRRSLRASSAMKR